MPRHPKSRRLHPTHRAVRRLFPDNIYVQRLLTRLESLWVGLGVSTEPGQWLYHPGYRTLWIWEPDLRTQPLSYLVVILAHELGHVLDFDEKPHYRAITRDLHWAQVPDEIECSAFVRGFLLLQELHVPISLGQYLAMIETPMAAQVGWELLTRHGWALALQALAQGPLAPSRTGPPLRTEVSGPRLTTSGLEGRPTPAGSLVHPVAPASESGPTASTAGPRSQSSPHSPTARSLPAPFLSVADSTGRWGA